MIEFFKFPSQFGMRDASPFVLKLETYLRLSGLEYNTNLVMDPRKAPKGKLPYITDGDETIADSSLCITYLKAKYGNPLGEGFSPQQHAIGHAVKTMFEERTYWVLVNDRWMDKDNQIVIRDAWFGAIPVFIRGFIFGKIIKSMKRDMHGHGIGRHTDEEIFALGLADIKAFESVLGDKAYLLGDSPSEYDASCYGLLANFMAKPFPNVISRYIGSSKTITDYISRVEKRAFG